MKRTPLFDKHLSLNAKMVPFAGWDMPVSYPAGIIAEHNSVRTNCGIFDIGHMGLIKIEGQQALDLIQYVGTNDASKLAINECQYSVLCNEKGGTIDDILVYRLPMNYMIICNACNFDKVFAWLTLQAKAFSQVNVQNYENYCLLSVQGPNAEKIVSQVLDVELNNLKHNHVLWWRDIIISRTGYTGEDGMELMIAKKELAKIWDAFMAQGIQPCGLGCRDTLRLEAGLPLYGHEYDEETSPLDVGYKWVVKFDKQNFIGKTALEKGRNKKLVGLDIQGRAIARAGDKIVDSRDSNIGVVTSGTFSPTFKKPIAMGFVPIDPAQSEVFINIRNNNIPAKIVAKTFYKR